MRVIYRENDYEVAVDGSDIVVSYGRQSFRQRITVGVSKLTRPASGVSEILRRSGRNPGDYLAIGPMVYRKGAQVAIEQALTEIAEAEVARLQQAKADLLAAVPGIDVLDAAYNAQREYDAALSAMINDEHGVFPPEKPRLDIKALRRQYPRAVAYRRARAEAHASTPEYSAAGRLAMTRLEAGDDVRDVMRDMDAAIAAYTHRDT